MTGKRANQGSDRLVPDFINGIGHKRTNHLWLKSTFVRFGPKADKFCGAAIVR